jgi:hypothetical protein
MRNVVLLIALAVLPLQAVEPTPREVALKLVPPDAALCFVVQGLRDRAAAVKDSPFAAWATEKVGPALAARSESQALKLIEATITKQIGLSLDELRDDIFGDILVQAFRPGPPDKPGEDRSLIILHARDGKKLERLIEKLNQLQVDGGELTGLHAKTHRGLGYFERRKKEGRHEYYRLNGSLFIFAQDEDALKAAIDREVNTVEMAPLVTAFAERGAEKALIAVSIAPRAFDAQIGAVDGGAAVPVQAGQLQTARLWKAVDQFVIALTAESELEFNVALAYKAERLPEEFRPWLSATPKPSAFWSAAPADALAVVAIEAEAAALLNATAFFLPPADRPRLMQQIEQAIGPVIGKANVAAVIAGLGPDWGAYAAPVEGRWFPSVVAAARVRSDNDAAVPGRVKRVCGFYLQAFQVDFNRKHDDQLELVEETINGVELKHLVNANLFPPGISPTLAVHEGFMLATSTPGEAAAFKGPTAVPPAKGEVPLIALNVKGVHTHLTQHHKTIAAWVAARQDRAKDEVEKEIASLLPMLEPVEGVEVVVRGDASSRTLALRVKLVKPLK